MEREEVDPLREKVEKYDLISGLLQKKIFGCKNVGRERKVKVTVVRSHLFTTVDHYFYYYRK